MPDKLDGDLDGISIRVGHRAELDLKFRKAVLDNLPEDKSITIWIKEVIVEWAEARQIGQSIVDVSSNISSLKLAEFEDKFRRLQWLETKLTDLENRIKNGQITAEIKDEIANDNELSPEMKAKLEKNFVDQF